MLVQWSFNLERRDAFPVTSSIFKFIDPLQCGFYFSSMSARIVCEPDGFSMNSSECRMLPLCSNVDELRPCSLGE